MPRKTRRRTKSRKQKVINMIGCSNGRHDKSCKRSFLSKRGGQGCGSTGCPIAPLSVAKMNEFSNTYKPPIFQNGGCGSCGINLMKGGNSFYKPAPLMPGPFVGSAWAYDKLPGKDPALQMTMNDAGYKTMNSMIGGRGKKIKGRCKNMKGGLMSQDLVNLGRDFTYNFNSAYNALNGYSAPTNPLPYKDQLTNTVTINRI
jgi:hypothetical protein